MIAMKLDARCCCGHEYGDHKHREPHACTECVCTRFQLPMRCGSWMRSPVAPPDPVHLASLREGQRARLAALESIERTDVKELL